MRTNVHGLMMLAVGGWMLGALAATGAAQTASAGTQIKAFADWPAGVSPAEIGKKVANLAGFPNRPGAHYAADSAWMSALKFAALTKDETLKTKLVKGLDPASARVARQSGSFRL